MVEVVNVQARSSQFANSKRWAWVEYDGQPLWHPCWSLEVAESSLTNRIKDWRLVVVPSGDDVGRKGAQFRELVFTEAVKVQKLFEGCNESFLLTVSRPVHLRYRLQLNAKGYNSLQSFS